MRSPLLVTGAVLCAFATALYVGMQLGRGPRDRLMIGLARRSDWSTQGATRTVIEVTVLMIGVMLGGVAGIGTIVLTLGVGPLTQWLLRYLVVQSDRP